jgi:Mor family transcriptional regulator
MSYINAESVLPKEVISMIQQYVDSKPLYIPRKNENKKSWGENNGTRETLKKRNNEIYTKYLNGVKIFELTRIYYLSEKSVRRIIRQEKIQSS